MEQKKLLKWGKNKGLGDGREHLVTRYLEAQGYSVTSGSFVEDTKHQLDLIASKPWEDKAKYIQVEGFHTGDKDYSRLIAYAKLNKAIPLIARVSKNGKVYFYSLNKKSVKTSQ